MAGKISLKKSSLKKPNKHTYIETYDYLKGTKRKVKIEASYFISIIDMKKLSISNELSSPFRSKLKIKRVFDS